MPIKHLVISGGGPTLVQALGAIQYVEQQKFIDLSTADVFNKKYMEKFGF